MSRLPRSIPVRANTREGSIDNDCFAVDLGARLQQAFGTAERERYLAVNRVVAQTERGLDAAARAGSARQEAR